MSATNSRGRCPALVFTGERAKGRVCVRVGGRRLALTYSQFSLLVRLVIARGTTATGFIQDADGTSLPVAVCRLRRAIRETAGRRAGTMLVQTGAGQEYRLGLLLTQVARDRSCAELVRTGFVTARELEELRRLCRLL